MSLWTRGEYYFALNKDLIIFHSTESAESLIHTTDLKTDNKQLQKDAFLLMCSQTDAKLCVNTDFSDYNNIGFYAGSNARKWPCGNFCEMEYFM